MLDVVVNYAGGAVGAKIRAGVFCYQLNPVSGPKDYRFVHHPALVVGGAVCLPDFVIAYRLHRILRRDDAAAGSKHRYCEDSKSPKVTVVQAGFSREADLALS